MNCKYHPEGSQRDKLGFWFAATLAVCVWPASCSCWPWPCKGIVLSLPDPPESAASLSADAAADSVVVSVFDLFALCGKGKVSTGPKVPLLEVAVKTFVFWLTL